MKRISKLMALLLAIALVLSVAAPAIATEEKKEDISSGEYKAVLEALIENFPNLPVDQQLNFLISYGDDNQTVYAFLDRLNEEQYQKLMEYSIETLNLPMPATATFTSAGSFKPAVNVAPASMRLRAASTYALANEGEEVPVDNGLELDKKAIANDDGTYTITLEAYTTGNVTVSSKTIPVDIVLVLDQSASMAYDFKGSDTNTNTDRRQYAMKQAVNSFISEVNNKYSVEADHRIAIVTFASEATTILDWTKVDENGKTNLQGKINALPDEPTGGTQTGSGMSQAVSLMNEGYNYTGSNTDRQRVVILFTDGVPGQSGYDTSVATAAIQQAKQLKDAGVTVYSVGIFNGANPSELYGEKWDYTIFGDITCTGEVGSYWGGSWVTSIIGSNDFAGIDIAAGNRFLNYLSSNFAGATEIGLEREWYNPGNHPVGGGTGYKITNNFKRTDSSYYLTASNSDGLKNIFKSIADKIQSANIDLGANTVVKDIVTPYFNMPSNTSAINLYTAAYDGTVFGERVAANDLTVAIDPSTQTVSVTGFDYNANFVSETAKSDGTYGKKLIIEFTVTPKTDFLGGNDVPTNGAASGVYADSSAETAVENFNVPEVDVPVKTITPVVQNQNIYLTNAADLKELVKDMGKFTVDGTSYTVDGTNNAYVNITYTIKDGDTVIATYTIDAGKTGGTWSTATGQTTAPELTDDTAYTITCTVAPTTTKETNPAKESDPQTATVNVFKPEITFQDSVEDYLSTHIFPAYYTDTSDAGGNNHVSTVWKHGDMLSTAEGISVRDSEPTLSFDYFVAGTDIQMADDGKTGTIIAMQDIPVNVTVKVDKPDPNEADSTTWDITGYTTFVHQCTLTVNDGLESACGWSYGESHPGNTENPEFLIHVKNIVADLTITKTGLDVYAYTDGSDKECAIITVTVTDPKVPNNSEVYRFALSTANPSVTIKDLKVGSTYTIAEENGWTWRYQNYGGYNGTIVMNPNNAPNTNKVTINNKANNHPYWLGGDNYAVNVFGTTSDENAGSGNASETGN